MTDRTGPADASWNTPSGPFPPEAFLDRQTHQNTSIPEKPGVAMELETALPRGDGADAPQSELHDGAMALNYSEQNFNQLVAANTAMQSELAARDAIVTDLRERIGQFMTENARLEKAWNEVLKQANKAGKDFEDERSRHEYTKALLSTEQRRLERSKGYIDRFLDDAERYSEPQKVVRDVPRPPVGPGLDEIYDPPMRQATDGDGMSAYATIRAANFDGPTRTPRRY